MDFRPIIKSHLLSTGLVGPVMSYVGKWIILTCRAKTCIEVIKCTRLPGAHRCKVELCHYVIIIADNSYEKLRIV